MAEERDLRAEEIARRAEERALRAERNAESAERTTIHYKLGVILAGTVVLSLAVISWGE